MPFCLRPLRSLYHPVSFFCGDANISFVTSKVLKKKVTRSFNCWKPQNVPHATPPHSLLSFRCRFLDQCRNQKRMKENFVVKANKWGEIGFLLL